MLGFLVPIATWLGANPAALAGLAVSVGLGLGYLSGKVNGWFECRSDIRIASEQARVQSVQRDLEIAKKAHQVDRKLAEKLQKELQKAKDQINEIADKSQCGLSNDDVKRLRNIR